MRDSNQKLLRLTLEASGVQFIPENGGGRGTAGKAQDRGVNVAIRTRLCARIVDKSDCGIGLRLAENKPICEDCYTGAVAVAIGGYEAGRYPTRARLRSAPIWRPLLANVSKVSAVELGSKAGCLLCS